MNPSKTAPEEYLANVSFEISVTLNLDKSHEKPKILAKISLWSFMTTPFQFKLKGSISIAGELFVIKLSGYKRKAVS